MSKRVIAALVEDLKETFDITSCVDVMKLMVAALMKTSDAPELTDDQKIHPAFTAGDVRALGAFWKADWLLSSLLGGYITRESMDVVGPNVMAYVDSPDDLILLTSTMENIHSVAMEAVLAYRDTLPDGELNADAVEALTEKIRVHHDEMRDKVQRQALDDIRGIIREATGLEVDDHELEAGINAAIETGSANIPLPGAADVPADAFVVSPTNRTVH